MCSVYQTIIKLWFSSTLLLYKEAKKTTPQRRKYYLGRDTTRHDTREKERGEGGCVCVLIPQEACTVVANSPRFSFPELRNN